jgi:hypothetical protein
MRKFLSLTVATLLALAVLAENNSARAIGVAYQSVFINNRFEDEIVNPSNNTPHAGYTANRSPTLAGTYSNSGATLRIPGPPLGPGAMKRPNFVYNSTTAGGRGDTVFAAGTAGHASQSVGIYSHPYVYGSGSDRGRMQVSSGTAATPFAGTTTGTYEFSFDLSLPSTFAGIPTPDTSLWSIVPGISLQSNYGSTSPFGNPGTDLFKVRFSSGNLVVDYLNGTRILVNNFSPNTVYSINTLSNMDNDRFTIAVNGVQVGGVLDMLAPTNPLSNQGIGGYLIRGGSATTAAGNPDRFTMYFDNIYLASTPTFVPEPSSAILLGLGIGGLVFHRRKKRLTLGERNG